MNKWSLIVIVVATLLLVACKQETDEFKQASDVDFCKNIHRNTDQSLSSQLKIVEDKMKTSTGVFSLEEGDVSMIARAWLTEYAEKTIDIQYFIFSTDNVGLIATDYLLRAADRGVRVRILVDDIMVDANAEALLALNNHPNLTIKIYNPNANIGKNISEKIQSLLTDFRGFNQRMHNKTFIVDGKVVITGGRNIADEYFDYDHEYNFRDRDVLLLGEVTNQVNNSFENFWNDSRSVDVNKVVTNEKNDLNLEELKVFLNQYACNPDNFWPQVRARIADVPQAFDKIQASGKLRWLKNVTFISDVPGKNDGTQGLSGGGITTDSLVSLINRANKQIIIQSPYLVTTNLSRNLFKAAVKRGVSIKILTNSLASTDNLDAFNGYQRDRDELLDTGVEIYEFKPDAEVRYEIMTGALQEKVGYSPIFGLHAKSMTIDNEIAVVGTFNLDPRSANLNTECITLIYDSIFASELSENMLIDMQPENAWQTTYNFNPDSAAGTWKELKAKTRRIVPKSIL